MDANELNRSESARLANSRLVVLTAIFLLVPHTLYIQTASAIDNIYISWTLIALVWAFSYTYGSNIVGPYSEVAFSLPEALHLIIAAGIIVPSIFLVWTVYQYSTGRSDMRLGLRVILVAVVILIVSGAFWGAADGWLRTYAIPLPLLQLLACLLVYRKPLKQVKPND